METVFGTVDLEGRPPAEPLVPALVSIEHLVEAVLITALLRVPEAHGVKALLIVRAMAALHDAVLPRRVRSAEAVLQAQPLQRLLEGRAPLGVRAVSHRKLEGVVCPGEVK